MLDSNRLQRLQQASLWDFALSFYNSPGVEGACLVLQDKAGVDVCELLLHGWLYQHGLQATPDELAVEREKRLRWQQEITAVLRRLRRSLKPQAAINASVAALRKTIQQAELEAERENLQCWQQWACQVSEDSQKLTNLVVNEHDVATWLQSRFFLGSFDTAPQVAPHACEEVCNAWNALAQQLDRFE